jgi:hypothetical protein
MKKTVLQAIALYIPNRKMKYYTEAEDRNLLNFIVRHERYKIASGVRLWKLMERKKVVPGKGTLLIGMFMKVILVQ